MTGRPFQHTAVLANNRLEWKGLPGTNMLTYYEHSKITDVKSSLALSLVLNVIELFEVVIYEC